MTRRRLIIVAVAGVLVGVLAVFATTVLLGARTASYKAEAELSLVPPANLDADDTKSAWNFIEDGQPASIAADVLRQPQWLTPAAAAAGLPADDITLESEVIVAPGGDTGVVALTVTTTDPDAAEKAADAVVAAATPLIRQVAGPVDVKIIQGGAGNSESSTISRTDVYAIVFIAGLLLGSALAYPFVRAGSKAAYAGASRR